MSSLMIFVTAFPMILRSTSPIPMGLTPGSFDNGMSLHPTRAQSGFDVPFRRDLGGALTKVPRAGAQNGY